MPIKKYNTEEERHAAVVASKRKYYQKKKAASKTNAIPVSKINYATLYSDALAKIEDLTNKLTTAEAKNEQYDKLCKSFAEKEKIAQDALNRATMEYNARIDYMLDTVKHAYIGMQFAVNASKKETK